MRDYLPVLAEALTGMFLSGLLVAACAAALSGCAHEQKRPTVGEGEALVCHGALTPEGVPVMVCVPYSGEEGRGEAL